MRRPESFLQIYGERMYHTDGCALLYYIAACLEKIADPERRTEFGFYVRDSGIIH